MAEQESSRDAELQLKKRARRRLVGASALVLLAVIVLPLNIWTLAGIFALGGIYVAMEETLEDSFCAELVGAQQHGMGFGVLATVNGIGDFISSLMVGLLWTAFGIPVAFGYCAALFLLGAWMVLRIAPATRTE